MGSAIKSNVRLETLAKLYKSIAEDSHFLEHLNSLSFAKPLTDLIKLPSCNLLPKYLLPLLETYDPKLEAFSINGLHLQVTLEDVLFLTGLPIRGKPVVWENSRDIDALERVFGLPRKSGSPELAMIVKDKNISLDTRVKALLIMVIHGFIVPSNSKSPNATYVQFVEQLDKVGEYAWGAALLAFLYNGLRRFALGEKISVDGNLWIVLAFFLIRIPKLGGLMDKCEISIENSQVPLLGRILSACLQIHHDTRTDVDTRVKTVLDTLTDADVLWTPYDHLELPETFLEQKPLGTFLGPIFCNNVVVNHKPHNFPGQFTIFSKYDVTSCSWKEKKINLKENRGAHPINIFNRHKKHILDWNCGKLAQAYMVQLVEEVDVHMDDYADNIDNNHVEVERMEEQQSPVKDDSNEVEEFAAHVEVERMEEQQSPVKDEDVPMEVEHMEILTSHVKLPQRDRMKRKPMLSNIERSKVYYALLGRSVNGKLRRTSTTEVANMMSISIQTVRRIWAIHKKTPEGLNVDVSHTRSNCGRKRLEIDLARILEIPLQQRTTLRLLSFVLGISPSTLHRLLKRGLMRRHSNAIRPHLKAENKLACLEFCLSMIDMSNFPNDARFIDMYNYIHIDEKWFYMTKKKETYYLFPTEEDPSRTCQSKNFIGKVMFLDAMARPRFDSEGNEVFSGKIVVFPFVTQQQARRRSRNRDAGTLEMKPITSVTREVFWRRWLSFVVKMNFV